MRLQEVPRAAPSVARGLAWVPAEPCPRFLLGRVRVRDALVTASDLSSRHSYSVSLQQAPYVPAGCKEDMQVGRLSPFNPGSCF